MRRYQRTNRKSHRRIRWVVLNSDDYWELDKLAYQVDFMDRSREYAALFGRVSFVDREGRGFRRAICRWARCSIKTTVLGEGGCAVFSTRGTACAVGQRPRGAGALVPVCAPPAPGSRAPAAPGRRSRRGGAEDGMARRHDAVDVRAAGVSGASNEAPPQTDEACRRVEVKEQG